MTLRPAPSGLRRGQRKTAPGISTDQAATLSGLTRRQLDYYVRAGAVAPSVHRATGSGDYHRWSGADVARLIRVAERIAWGMTPEAALRDVDPPLPAPLPAPTAEATPWPQGA